MNCQLSYHGSLRQDHSDLPLTLHKIRLEKIRFIFNTVKGLGAGGVKFAPGFIGLAKLFFAFVSDVFQPVLSHEARKVSRG